MNKQVNPEKYRNLSVASLATGLLADVIVGLYLFFLLFFTDLLRNTVGDIAPACIIFGLSIAAVVCGSIDLERIKTYHYSNKGKGFDIAGIILGVIFTLFTLVFMLGEIIVSYINNQSLQVKIFFLILAAIIFFLFLFLFINYKKKKNKILEKNVNEILSGLKDTAYLRSRGFMSRENYEYRKNTILGDKKKLDMLWEKIASPGYLDKYSKSIDEPGEGIIIVEEGIIIHISQNTLEVLGYLKKDIISKRLIAYIHPDDLDSFIQYHKNIYKGKNLSSNKVFRLLSFNRDIKWFEISSIFISKKKIVLISFLKDVTGIIQTESELAEALDSYYKVFEHSPASFWEIDVSDLKDYLFGLRDFGSSNGEKSFNYYQHLFFQFINSIKIVNLNKTNPEVFNISNKSKLLENMFKLISNDFRDIFIKLFKAISIGEFSDEAEINLKTFSGKEKYAIAKFIIVKNNEETYLKVLLFINDITEQKAMIRKIQDLGQFHESVINDASIWFSVFDNNLNAIIWNKAAEQISGYSKEEVLDKNDIWGMLYPDSAEQESIKNKITNFDKNGCIEEFETTIKCKNGDSKIVLWNIKKLTDSQNNKGGFINIGYDYTEKKDVEEKITHIAMHDSLTGLYNRTFFEEHLDLMFKERDLKVGLIILDIDGLKYVNDTLGHQQGDKIIISVTKIFNNTFRPSDIICRIGGDEFTVLLRNIDEQQIESVLQRLKTKVKEYNNNLKINKYPLDVSFGYSIKDNKDKTAFQSFKEADDMLFENKILKKEAFINSVLIAIRAAMLEKDAITEEHLAGLKSLAANFAEAMGFDDTSKEKLVIATELHDIGKVVIPDEILNKSGALNSNESAILKNHSKLGYRIASLTPSIKDISELILYSHERWDGQGYPEGLKGEEIPVISRMVHIIDAYDAMINNRPYKKEMSGELAIAELKKCSGLQFDPNLIDIFLKKVLKI